MVEWLFLVDLRELSRIISHRTALIVSKFSLLETVEVRWWHTTSVNRLVVGALRNYLTLMNLHVCLYFGLVLGQISEVRHM